MPRTFGHGGDPDKLRYYLSFWTGGAWSLLSESQTRGQSLPNATWRKMRDLENQPVFAGVQLAVFVGCATANRPGQNSGPESPSGWGSPAGGAKALGARTTVGFYKSIQSHYLTAPNPKNRYLGAEEWDQMFWQVLRDGFSVKDAVRRANDQTGMHDSLKSAVILGDEGLKLAPALVRSAGGG
jgi:hypothetical protein